RATPIQFEWLPTVLQLTYQPMACFDGLLGCLELRKIRRYRVTSDASTYGVVVSPGSSVFVSLLLKDSHLALEVGHRCSADLLQFGKSLGVPSIVRVIEERCRCIACKATLVGLRRAGMTRPWRRHARSC